jgi:hypothetical protein
MGSERTHGPAGSEIQRRRITSDSLEIADANETAANDLGALALFGSEEEPSIETPVVGRKPDVPGPSQDPVRNLRTRLAADSRSRGFPLVLTHTAALKRAVGDYASKVRSSLALRLREYLVRHPKLPAQAGLIACIVFAAVIVGHYVGRIDVVRIPQVPSQSPAPARVASESPTAGSPVLATPIRPPAVQRQPADRPTNVRAQLPPARNAQASKPQAPKPQRSTIVVDNSNSRSRRAENPRPREIGRETPTTLRTGAADPVIAPPSSVSAAAPLVAASARPTAALSAPASPVTGINADYERSAPIYSAQDIDVRPPQMLEADLPRPAVLNWPTIKNSMELVVTADGSVERVKWLTSRERMPDVMLLSRAKTWKFSPALREGHPVRYRLIVTWEVNP